MKCVLIVSPGENLEGASELHRMGYKIEPYPSTQDLSALTDLESEESARFLGSPLGSQEVRPHVRSLRASFVRLLRDHQYDDNDLIILGESDTCPQISSARLEQAMKKELAEHPETDVFRLFHCWSTNTEAAPPQEGEISFEDFRTGPHHAGNAYVWGTHALVVPASKREKLAAVFADYRLPTDIALEAAHSNGELKVRVARHNLFYQHPRRKLAGDKKLAICLSSYKRLQDLQRQLWGMMDQSYSNIHVFAAIKGIPEGTYRKTVLPLFEHFIEEGRLTMRLFPNKNQLSNFLDTVRELDVSGYDLFLKIDDDDSYGRDYCQAVNDFHRMLPPCFSSFHAGPINYLTNKESYPFVYPGFLSIFGPTIVFSREVLDKLFACERDPQNINRISQHIRHLDYGFHEDELMDIIMQEMGCCNRAEYIQSLGMPMNAVIRRDNASVMRGGLLSGDFSWRNQTIRNEKMSEESVLEVRHPHWHGLVHILGGRAKRLGMQEMADVLLLNDDTLILQWDKWGAETFVKNDDTGAFVLKCPADTENINLPKIALLITATGHRADRWKQCLASCRKHFLKGYRVRYFLLTDRPDSMDTQDEPRVKFIQRKAFAPALAKLNRFYLEPELEQELEAYDFLYFIDEGLHFCMDVGMEILPLENQALTVMYSVRDPLHQDARFFGGRHLEVLHLCRELHGSIRGDMLNGFLSDGFGDTYFTQCLQRKNVLSLEASQIFGSFPVTHLSGSQSHENG